MPEFDELFDSHCKLQNECEELRRRLQRLELALRTMRDYAREAAAINDADHIRGNSIKAHKMLMALGGLSPRYDARIDEALAALSGKEGDGV